MTRMRAWVRAHPNVLLLVFFSTLAFFGFRDLREQNDRLTEVVADLEAEGAARQQGSCESADETRDLIRDMSKNGDLEVGESLIEVAGAQTDPQAEQLREVLDRRLTAIVNQLPGRRWDPESQRCVDVELDQ